MSSEASDRWGMFVFGLIVGILLFSSAARWQDDSIINQYNNAIKECEKNLPRDQTCKIIAVPK